MGRVTCLLLCHNLNGVLREIERKKEWKLFAYKWRTREQQRNADFVVVEEQMVVLCERAERGACV